MSVEVYNNLLSTAGTLIEQFGRDVTFQRVGEPIDPAKPWLGKGIGDTETIKAAVFESSGKDRVAFPDVTFTRRALIAGDALDSPPTEADQVQDQGITYGISQIITYAPGTVIVAYALLLTTER